MKKNLAPLFVDLDNSFLKTDTLHECCLKIALSKPWLLLLFPLWLLSGKAAFKRRVAKEAKLDIANLPVNQEILSYLEKQAATGRGIFLMSGADDSIVKEIVAQYDVFEGGWGSDGVNNLTGEAKVEKIIGKVGTEFSYLGDSKPDIVIWKAAETALLAGSYANKKAEKQIKGQTHIEARFKGDAIGFVDIVKLLKLHHWVKNLILFLPIVLIPKDIQLETTTALIVGFLGFSILVSATYLINDLFDLNSDRQHPYKSQRPLASGKISIFTAISLIPICIILFATLSQNLPVEFKYLAITYAVVSLVYSTLLKQMVILDLLAIGGMFTLRVAIGLAIIGATPSIWLATYAMLFFSSLAAVKRYIDIYDYNATKSGSLAGRGYDELDLPFLMSFGLATSSTSTVVLILYLLFDGHPSSTSYLLISVPVIAYWTFYIWRLAIRGEMHVDPVIFAVRDKTSVICGVIVICSAYMGFMF
jgi:4-hydroxybenzoate polyprenyltransferase